LGLFPKVSGYGYYSGLKPNLRLAFAHF
jgi:hypothetical protein